MTFPLLFTVAVHSYSAGSIGDYGETAAVYTPPLDTSGTEVAVYGWSTPSSVEPKLAGHDRVVVDQELLVPPENTIGAHDLVDLPDGQYQVIGEPEDMNNGPFGWQPGKVVNLRRVTG